MGARAVPRIVSAAIVLALLTPSASADRTQGDLGLNGRIVFVSDRDGYEELYLLTESGSQQTRLTNNSVPDDDPVWAPDGSGLIAFVRSEDQLTDIYVKLGFGTERRVTADGGSKGTPSYSPAAGKLAFTGSRDGSDDVYVVSTGVPIGKSEAVNVTRDPSRDRQPSWSPAEARIAFVSDRDGDDEIYVMASDGSGARAVTRNDVDDSQPDWSPDGSRIALVRRNDTSADIYVVGADGSNERRLTDDAAEDVDPAWSPDGRLIVFASAREGNLEIYVMDANGDNETNYSNSSRAADRAPDWENLPPAESGQQKGSIDVPYAQNKPCTVRGTRRADRGLLGGPGDDVICAYNGSDVIRAGRGRDTIKAGVGRDVIYARDGTPDLIFGGPGFDSVYVDRVDDVRNVERRR
jgi:Tol biopolymer transport system component